MKKNIIANIFGKFWSIFSNFLFVPLYIKYLGFESYAIISFTLVLSGFMAILDSGLSFTLSREFSRADKSILEKTKIFETLETLFFIISGITIFILFVFSDFIANNWLNLTEYTPSLISYLIKFVVFEIGFQLLFRFYVGGLLGLEKQVPANLFQIGWGIVRNGLVVVAILFFPTLEMFFAWQMFSTIIFTFFLAIYLRKKLTGRFNFLRLQLNPFVLNDIWKFAGGILLIGVVASINTQMDKLVISNLLPVKSLGFYSLAIAISGGIYIITGALSAAFQPRFTYLFSASKSLEAKQLFRRVNILVSIVIFTIMSIMIFFSKELIWVWTGNKDLIEHVAYLIPITALSYAMLSLQIIPFNVAIANGYTKLNTIMGIISLFVTLPGYYILTKKYDVLGAAITFCFVQLLITVIYLLTIIKKYDLIRNTKYFYFKQFFLPLLISIILSWITFYPIKFMILERFEMLIWIGFSTILVFIGTLLVSFPKKYRSQFLDIKM